MYAGMWTMQPCRSSEIPSPLIPLSPATFLETFYRMQHPCSQAAWECCLQPAPAMTGPAYLSLCDPLPHGTCSTAIPPSHLSHMANLHGRSIAETSSCKAVSKWYEPCLVANLTGVILPSSKWHSLLNRLSVLSTHVKSKETD